MFTCFRLSPIPHVFQAHVVRTIFDASTQIFFAIYKPRIGRDRGRHCKIYKKIDFFVILFANGRQYMRLGAFFLNNIL